MANLEKFVQPAIPRFDGHYDYWAMTMENFLRSREMWNLVEEGIPTMAIGSSPANEAQRRAVEERRRSRKARGKSKSDRKSRRMRRKYDDDSNSSSDSESESESESEYSDSEESESEDERRSWKRKRRKREKEKKKRKKGDDGDRKRKEKKKKKKKKSEKGKKGAVTKSWGKYGIIRETDMWNKRPKFTAWLLEVKEVNLESLPPWEEKKMFKDFMEDHNTGTFKSKKSVLHGRSKHIHVRFHFLRELVKEGTIQLDYCVTQDQVADVMTKAVKLDVFEDLRGRMGVKLKED